MKYLIGKGKQSKIISHKRTKLTKLYSLATLQGALLLSTSKVQTWINKSNHQRMCNIIKNRVISLLTKKYRVITKITILA